MSETLGLRLRDMRDVFRLVSECRELWADPSGWQEHLLRGACRLAGARVGVYAEAPDFPPDRPPRPVEVTTVGWPNKQAKLLFDESIKTGAIALHPDYRPMTQALCRRPRVTARLADVVDRQTWRNSITFTNYSRPMELDQHIVSLHRLTTRSTVTLLKVRRGLNDGTFSRRDWRIIDLLHAEVAPLIGTTLATSRHRSMHGLAPRLREVLDHLLAGESEKQIALRLRLSRPTINQYVGILYRHFGMASRGELLSYFVRRQPSE